MHFLHTSFFELFDFIYDYTFFCALHPSLHTEWAQQMIKLLKPGGLLCTLIYPIMPREGGPPFEVSMQLYQAVLLPHGFTELQLDMLPDALCHPGREGGKCALGIWRKPE